ncbi:MAG: diguanylate cyclase [Clostridia bacterium]|nr:diguanylate cyclase [Clostridia bacterium]
MHSIRTRITVLTVCAIIVALTVTAAVAAVSIRNLGDNSSKEILSNLCAAGEKDLDSYFESVERSVKIISDLADLDLENTSLDDLDRHMEKVRTVFEKTANNNPSIKTYYYRVDPEVPTDEKGFWFVNLDGAGFTEHEVTDITLYDTSDQTSLVWFTVPKVTGKAVWLPPYITDNLDVYVLSYNVPIYKGDMFIGVIGIEIDYTTMAEVVNSITLYENGYAFINDGEGKIIFHPHIPEADLIAGKQPTVPDGLISEDEHVTYTYEGVEKRAAWRTLENGMRLNVCVPTSEIDIEWQRLIIIIIVISAVLLVIVAFFTERYIGHITKPLAELTEAANEVNKGNYDFKLSYNRDDEVGILTKTFSRLIGNLKVYISDLNSLVYADALTSVRNKGAFDVHARELQTRINKREKGLEFAICLFDCNDLKHINDEHGHDKGDVYLKTASSLISRVFHHSPVFRVGGDEFVAILQYDDYKRRDQLLKDFEKSSADMRKAAEGEWERVSVAIGIAAYDPETDESVDDVLRRADKLMYEDKRIKKGTE